MSGRLGLSYRLYVYSVVIFISIDSYLDVTVVVTAAHCQMPIRTFSGGLPVCWCWINSSAHCLHGAGGTTGPRYVIVCSSSIRTVTNSAGVS